MSKHVFWSMSSWYPTGQEHLIRNLQILISVSYITVFMTSEQIVRFSYWSDTEPEMCQPCYSSCVSSRRCWLNTHWHQTHIYHRSSRKGIYTFEKSFRPGTNMSKLSCRLSIFTNYLLPSAEHTPPWKQLPDPQICSVQPLIWDYN